jgi:hypothetical protein
LGLSVLLPFAQLSIGEMLHLQGHWEAALHYYETSYTQAEQFGLKRAAMQIAYRGKT